jgi:hypothetical protein
MIEKSVNGPCDDSERVIVGTVNRKLLSVRRRMSRVRHTHGTPTRVLRAAAIIPNIIRHIDLMSSNDDETSINDTSLLSEFVEHSSNAEARFRVSDAARFCITVSVAKSKSDLRSAC